jgi:hypothetical protein
LLCQQACDRVKNCGQVDLGACETQCGKELLGEGYLIQEIARDYFLTLKDFKENECTYKMGAYWEKWGPNKGNSSKFDVLLEQDEFQACMTHENKCDGETPLMARQADCMSGYYQWNKEIRAKLKPCYSIPKCLDRIGCLFEGFPSLPEQEPWLAGVPDPLAE